MTILTTSTFTGTIPPIPMVSLPPPAAPQIMMPDPISYEFQVVEHIKDGKIDRVALQVKRNTHDQYGNIKIVGMWVDVPRVRVEL